jgi:hypothetical protein
LTPNCSVLEEMRTNLLVQEQINTILFGVTYEKKKDFFISEKFFNLVEGLTYSDDLEEVLIGGVDESSEISQMAKSPTLKGDRSITENIIKDRSDFWKQKIRGFLLKSNEKWILDQFNLCKRFLNQNSIDGSLKDFQHQVFDNFSFIQNLKGKSDKRNLLRIIMKQKLDSLGKQKAIKEMKEEEYKIASAQPDKQEILKVDVNALLKVIEEIENKIKMEKILVKNMSQKEIEKDEQEKIIRGQFAMLNFHRNYMALEYSQKYPTDERNKISI